MKKQLRIYVLCFLFVINPKSVITHTLFFFLFNMMHIPDIFVVWLMTIIYVIGTRLLNVVGVSLLRIRYVASLGRFIGISSFGVCR